MTLDLLIETIVSNLQKNGFPGKKVSLPKTALENFSKKSDFDLEDVLGEMESQDLFHWIDGEKIVFSADPFAKKTEKDTDGIDWDTLGLDQLKNADPEKLKSQAKSFMDSLTAEQKEEAFKKFSSMSTEERNKLFEAAKKMGLS